MSHMYDWDYESDFDDETTTLGTWEEIAKKKVLPLNMSLKYVDAWTCVEAFRELYQNWKDAIMKANKLKHQDFQVEHFETDKQIFMQTFKPGTKELLGYILFKHKPVGESKERKGTLTMVNFNASIERKNMTLGGTTKDLDNTQAGQHGEGLKVACLVLAKRDYLCHIQTSGFNCYVKFDNHNELVCVATRIKDQTRVKQRVDLKAPRGLDADPCRDVSITIGSGKTKVWTAAGTKENSKLIPLDNFRTWVKTTLDINPPQNMVRTPYGALILNPEYAGAIYLMGLRLGDGTKESWGYADTQRTYGYNLFEGQTGRDRTMIRSSTDQAKNIYQIWKHAILEASEKSQELKEKYTTLLIDQFHKSGDVAMPKYETWLDREFVLTIWDHMLKKDDKPFYYCPSMTNGDAKTIIKENLERRPQLLTKELWVILRWSLGERLRTPQEEQNHLFERAPIVDPPHTNYVETLLWVLERCMSAFPESELMQFQFVDVANLSIDVAKYGSVWRINGKWLTKDGSHKHIFCPDHFAEETDPFPCQHTLCELWENIAELWKHTGCQPEKDDSLQPDQNFDYIKRKIARCIDDTPRNITCTRTFEEGELSVSWGPTGRALQIVLHRVDCQYELTGSQERPRSRFLNPGSKNDRKCECPTQTVDTTSHSCTFKGLDQTIKYRPSVSGCYKDAFIALPPQPVQPRDIEEDNIEQVNMMDVSEESDCVSEDPNWEPYESSSETYDSDQETGPLTAPVAGSPSSLARREPEKDLASQGGFSENNRFFDNRGSASLTVPASRPSQVLRNDSVQASYVPGDEVKHENLEWDRGFPSTHRFHSAVGYPGKDVYIAIRKEDQPHDSIAVYNENNKRVRTE